MEIDSNPLAGFDAGRTLDSGRKTLTLNGFAEIGQL